MLESIQNNTFEYEKLSQEEQEKRGILGRLKGVIADFKNPTRNGRLYGQKVWESVFDNPITQEKIANRCMFGEIEHPTDGRESIDPEKIAVCLAEQPKKDNQGHLIGVFDILSTPCGKILKTLLDYGTTVGVSSRGTGDTFVNREGQEEVDPDSYDCVGWDVVLIPAVKEARMTPITESVGNKSLKLALTESLNSANEEEKKVMQETLDNLGIKLEEDKQPEKVDDIQTTVENGEADNAGESLVEQLSTALLDNQKLQEKVSNLQEKLSVCYAKEYDYQDEIDRYKRNISKLTESVKSIAPLKQRVNTLTEELSVKSEKVNSSEKSLTESAKEIKTLNERISNLKEKVKEKNSSIEKLTEEKQQFDAKTTAQINELNETIAELNGIVEDLKTQVSNVKKDALLKQKEYSNNLEKQNQLVEKYKKVAKTSVNKYIESQADKLGVSTNEIKSKLNESYTFSDIDAICEDIQNRGYGFNSLPFGRNFTKAPKMKIHESIDPTMPINEDDIINDSLLSLAREL